MIKIHSSMANTAFTQKYTFLAVGTYVRSQAPKVDPSPYVLVNSKIKCNRFSFPEQKLGFRVQNDATRKMNMTVYAGAIPTGDPLPLDPSPGHWKTWVVGTVITILVSFFTKGKWGPLLQLKDKIETTIDGAERVADIVEEVAEKVEEMAEEAVKHLPDGKLRDAVEFVEKVAENVDKGAERAGDALQKVEDMEKELESFFDQSTTPQENAVAMATEAKDQK